VPAPKPREVDRSAYLVRADDDSDRPDQDHQQHPEHERGRVRLGRDVVTAAFVISAGIASPLITRIGTRPVIVIGAVIAAVGIYLLSRVPVHGTYTADLLPGLITMPLGAGAVFVGVTIAANDIVPAEQAGLAAGLLIAARQIGSALGLAIFSAIATSRTQHLLARHRRPSTSCR
jgi:hypothetical protein